MFLADLKAQTYEKVFFPVYMFCFGVVASRSIQPLITTFNNNLLAAVGVSTYFPNLFAAKDPNVF